MNKVICGSDLSNNTHHVSLTDGIRTLGFVVADSRGNCSPLNMHRTPLQTTAIKTVTGTQKYGDFNPPWCPVAQDSWEGGRGLEYHSDDSTRFYDSYRAQTAFEEIYNAPMEFYGTGIRDAYTNYPGSVSWLRLKDGATKYVAASFTCTANDSLGQVYLLVRRRGTPANALTIEVCSNNAGVPGTVLTTKTITTSTITDIVSRFIKVTITDVSLTSGAVYWIKVYSTESTDNDYWQVGINATAGTTYQSADDIIYTKSTFDLYYRATDAEVGYDAKFFTYRGLKFVISQTGAGAPRLFINGTIGVADANTGALSTLVDGDKTWTTNQWAGAKVGIIAGTGLEEASVYRNIVSNTGTVLTVDIPWTITHDTTTQYIIFNTDIWTLIPAEMHGLTARVTDVCVINDIVYFAQGDSVVMRRMRWAVDSGTGAGGWVCENETEKATYLCTLRHLERGLELWKANNVDKNGAISVSRATVIDWLGASITLLNQTSAVTAETYSPGVDFSQGDDAYLEYKMVITTVSGTNPKLYVTIQESDDNAVFTDVKSFQVADAAGTYYLSAHSTKRYRRCKMTVSGTNPSFNNILITTENSLRFHEPIAFHDSFGRITKIVEYSDDDSDTARKHLWVMREGMPFIIRTDTVDYEIDYADPLSLPELETVMEENNGSSAKTSNIYLYFPTGNSIQRYYNQQLDSNGPDRDAGLPSDRQGPVSSLLGYPGMYFATIDAGATGYSSILINNGSGWHELFRASNIGERIYDISYQAIPTEEPDRLWFNCGDDIMYLVMPSKTLKAIYDTHALYTHESVVVSSWHTAGMTDIIKQWDALKVISENLAEDSVFIEADYQTDSETIWHTLSDAFTEYPSQKIILNEEDGVTGKRMRYRLRLQTTDKTKTPRVKAVVIEAVGRVDLKYSYSFPYRIVAESVNLRGDYEDVDPEDFQEVLDDWASTITKLNMRCDRKLFDNKRVYLNAVSFNRIHENGEGYMGTITVCDI